MTTATAISLKKFVKVLVLMSLVFSLAAIAQTNGEKPLEAKALTSLIVELKEVVSKNSPDKSEAKLVGEKWDKRTDLSGKSKGDAIELLFEDVKSVIKDSGIQYQIYSIFSFYKSIPDISPPTETKDLSTMSKAELVSKLVELTLTVKTPTDTDEPFMPATPAETDSSKPIDDEESESSNAIYDEALELNRK